MEGLKKYEHISIFRGDLKDYTEVIEDFKKQFKNIISIEEHGLRKLAYTVKGNTQGYYIGIIFKATEKDIEKLEKYCRLNDNIIKFITIRYSD